MNYLEHEEEEPKTEELQRETLIGWCNEAYSLLQEQGLKAKTEKGKEQANLALRRMLALFIDQEEYEKCILLKEILDKNFGSGSLPLFDYRQV